MKISINGFSPVHYSKIIHRFPADPPRAFPRRADLRRVAISTTVTTMMVPGEEIPLERLNVTKRAARFRMDGKAPVRTIQYLCILEKVSNRKVPSLTFFFLSRSFPLRSAVWHKYSYFSGSREIIFR